MSEESTWDRAVFVSEQRTFTVKDVIDAADFRGELELPRKALLEMLARERAADPDEPDETALQTMSEQFRFERDLITAEETEHWLEERGLSLEDFSDYFVRHYWKEAAGQQPAAEMTRELVAPEELRHLLRVEFLLGGEFDRMAIQLSWRFAALHFSGNEIDTNPVDAERGHFFQRTGLDDKRLVEWLVGLDRDETWLNEMLDLEAAYRRQCNALVTLQACQRTLSFLRVPLTRVDVEIVEVDSRDAAREAFLCVAVDAASMADLARDGRYPYRRVEIALADLPAESQRQMLCAAPGEVLEPIKHGDAFHLVRLIRKMEPDLNNPGTRHRVEQQIVQQHFSELAAKCVRWTIPPGSSSEASKKWE